MLPAYVPPEGRLPENALQETKRHEEALATDDRAIQLDPANADAYNKDIALRDGDRLYYEDELAASNRAIQLAPNDATAYNWQGNALNCLHRYEEAVAAYDRAIQLDPNFASAYSNKGNALQKLGQKAEAEQAYKESRELGYKG